MVRWLTLALLCGLPCGARAAIGDPCEDDDGCPPGELCASAGDDGYCTKRCPMEGCPDGFRCTEARVCARGAAPPRVGFGEPCAEVACEDGLVCLADGDRTFCTHACSGPGSCPQDFRCAGQTTPACAPLNGLPGFASPCAADRGCADGLVCVDDPARVRPYCTTSCAEGEPCGGDTTCAEGTCRLPATQVPAFGEPCTERSAEPALAGCQVDLSCFVDGLNAYCTQPCDALRPCPDGYGCRFVDFDSAECRRGVGDDPGLSPVETFDVPVVAPPPSDAGVAAPPPAEDDDDDGCGVRPTGGGGPPLALLALLLPLALGLRRR